MGHTPVVPGNRSLRERHGELKVSLSYLVRLGLRNKRKQQNKKSHFPFRLLPVPGNHGTADLWVPS